jgi:gamma-glutamyl-gamma-aminobutyraldehyde dehydrogenase/4-guanidinobutyraldehyde dehydrogenase/NAD-dependent aldehyde dehydrogenase
MNVDKRETETVEDWRGRAAELKPRAQAFVAGRFVPAASGKTFAKKSPIDGRVLAEVAECDQADVDAAVKAARKAFEAGVWSRRAPAERKKVLLKLGELLMKHKDELALTETLDMGKPIRDSRAIDVPMAAGCISWFAELADKIYDEIAPTDPTALALITREPLGVVAAVVPWNFPLLMASWKVGPALAAGNSVVLKPAEQSPLTALRLGELAAEAGVPEGVFSVLPGFGSTAGKALGLHLHVDAVAFTGSTEVGKLFLQYAGQSNMKHVSLECGGKSPNIVLADAPDLDVAARAAATGIFWNQGEVCNAGSRLLVDARIKDDFLKKVIEVGQKMQPGDPLDPKTRMGAIVDETQLGRVLGYIEAGKQEGAALVAGGGRKLAETGGYYVEPTVFDAVETRMKIAQEEIFGPVLATLSFSDVDEAVKIGNDTMYGLAAAVWTRDLSTAHKLARRLRAGTVWINCFDHGDMTVPFGGFKQSGLGRDKSRHAFDKYTELKTTWIHLGK